MDVCLSLQVTQQYEFFGRPFVKWYALCNRTVVCLICMSVLCVTLVYSGQTVGWIRMTLGMEVCLSPAALYNMGTQLPP